MKDILLLIQNNTNTFKDFRKWLFEKLGKNNNSFHTFGKYPSNLKLPYLIEYLEYKKVPILNAYSYYYWKGSLYTMTHHQLTMYLVIEEFKRIEQNKIINYIPF